MRARIQASTDTAAFGLWDRAQGGAVSLEELARRGEACILNMGGDCGGPVEIFVDEEPPAALMAESDPVTEERTIAARSGLLAIDGVEHFGAGAPSSCAVPNGVYLARIRVTRSDDELPESESERQIRRKLGRGNVEHYDRANRNSLLLGAGILVVSLAVLPWFVRWFFAVPAALALFVGWFHVRERMLKRDLRYQGTAESIVPLRLAGERPLLVVQLSRWEGELRGGPPVAAPAASER
jgi:hypothetical protein